MKECVNLTIIIHQSLGFRNLLTLCTRSRNVIYYIFLYINTLYLLDFLIYLSLYTYMDYGDYIESL